MIQYLAGIFDAEGYVRIRKTKSGNNYSYTYECRIYMCELSIVNLFAERYDLTIKSSERGVNRKTAYYITFNGKDLRNSTFISDILPFLNEKRLQLQEIKNLIEGQDKETCYQKYLEAKKSFIHPIVGELSFPYIAGVIDGDGWFTMFNASKVVKSIRNTFAVGIEQRYFPLINYMLRFGGDMNIRTVKDSINHIQTYEWKIGDSSMLELLIAIEPFLIEKREKCQTLIKYIEKYEEFRQYSKKVLTWWKE